MRKDILKIFIGYDPVESVAWHTLVMSIYEKSTMPVAIVPVNIRNLKDIYKRERNPRQSNEFSFTRFLVPYLMDYEGYAVFMDCDMLLRVDIAELFNVIHEEPNKAVYVVKHDYVPRDSIKFLGTKQYAYPRKNWSSFVLWDCGHPANKILTADYVNTATPMELHRFQWLRDEEIGELDIKWNWLVGEYDNPPNDVKNIHWTVGGPYFKEYEAVEFSEEWKESFRKMIFCAQRSK